MRWVRLGGEVGRGDRDRACRGLELAEGRANGPSSTGTGESSWAAEERGEGRPVAVLRQTEREGRNTLPRDINFRSGKRNIFEMRCINGFLRAYNDVQPASTLLCFLF